MEEQQPSHFRWHGSNNVIMFNRKSCLILCCLVCPLINCNILISDTMILFSYWLFAVKHSAPYKISSLSCVVKKISRKKNANLHGLKSEKWTYKDHEWKGVNLLVRKWRKWTYLKEMVIFSRSVSSPQKFENKWVNSHTQIVIWKNIFL